MDPPGWSRVDKALWPRIPGGEHDSATTQAGIEDIPIDFIKKRTDLGSTKFVYIYISILYLLIIIKLYMLSSQAIHAI